MGDRTIFEHLTRGFRPFLGIALVACLVYANTVSNELVYDDLAVIPDQPVMRNPWVLGTIFGGRYFGDLAKEDPLYRPLTVWSLALNYGLNQGMGLPGEHAAGFHLANLVLHAMVCCVFYRFLIQINLATPAALGAAFLFAVHPVHTEAVASAVNRSELLAALFGFWFLIQHGQRSMWGALCFLLALWSKESAVAFFPLAICMDPVRSWRRYGFYGGVMLGWLGLRAMVIGGRSLGISELDNPLVHASFLERILTAGRVQLLYLKLQVWPVSLSSDYSFNQVPIISDPTDPGFLGFVAVVVGAGILAWQMRKAHSLISFAVVGYTVLFSVTGNFLFVIGTVMGERNAYAPSACFCLGVGYGAWLAYRRWGKAVIFVFVGLVVLLGGLSVARNRTWANERVFYETQLYGAPSSARANWGAGNQDVMAGKFDRGIARLHRAIEIWPDYSLAWSTLGAAYTVQGRLKQALATFETALDRGVDSASLRYNQGRAYQLQGEYEKAVGAYEAAIQMRPEFIQAYVNLGGVFYLSKRTADAERVWKQALKLDPRNGTLLKNLRALEQAPNRRN